MPLRTTCVLRFLLRLSGAGPRRRAWAALGCTRSSVDPRPFARPGTLATRRLRGLSPFRIQGRPAFHDVVGQPEAPGLSLDPRERTDAQQVQDLARRRPQLDGGVEPEGVPPAMADDLTARVILVGVEIGQIGASAADLLSRVCRGGRAARGCCVARSNRANGRCGTGVPPVRGGILPGLRDRGSGIRDREVAPLAHSALARTESLGSHQRTDHPARDDALFLRHSLAHRTDGDPRIEYLDVVITKWPPAQRRYGS